MKQIASNFARLNIFDFIKGGLVAILTAVLIYLQGHLQDGLHFDWQQIGTIATGALIAYLLKQYGTNSKGQLLTTESASE